MKSDLDNVAKMAFETFRRSGGDTRELSQDVAFAVGRHAGRASMSLMDVKKWLQSAYGSIWVRQNNLSPGADLKEIGAWIEKAYKSVKPRPVSEARSLYDRVVLAEGKEDFDLGPKWERQKYRGKTVKRWISKDKAWTISYDGIKRGKATYSLYDNVGDMGAGDFASAKEAEAHIPQAIKDREESERLWREMGGGQ